MTGFTEWGLIWTSLSERLFTSLNTADIMCQIVRTAQFSLETVSGQLHGEYCALLYCISQAAALQMAF